MATEAQTPEPISGKTIEEEIKPFICHQLHTASGVKAEDPARKAHPSFGTAEQSTKTEASRTNSSTLEVETVSEKPDGALDVEERENKIPVEHQKAIESELKKEQAESTKPDSEAKVTAAIIENKREDTEKPSVSSDEKYDDKVSQSLPERRKDDWDQEHTHTIPNEQNLDSTKECNVEAEAVDEEKSKTSDFSINKTGAPVETIDLKYENKHEEEMKQETIDLKYEIKHEEETNEIEVAKEEEKKEVFDNKLDMLSVSEETEGKMIEESSEVLFEYQNLNTGVDSERLQRSVELGSEGQNLEKIEESNNVGDPSSISGINLDSTSVLGESKETGNFPDLAFEASAMVPEENTDNGSVGATENIKSNVFNEEECVEKHIDTDVIPIKQELTDSCYQEDKIEGKELDETSNIEKNLETSDPCREMESQKLGREENPVSSLKDLSTAETVADPSIQNPEMSINSMNETKYSTCVSAHEENILETKNIIQNIEEEVDEEGLSAYDNVQPVSVTIVTEETTASVTIVTEETNLQKAELEDEKLEETSDVASDGIPETTYTTFEQKGENRGEVPKLVSEHPPGSDNTETKSPDLASDWRSPAKGYTTFEQREGENTGEAPKLESEYPPDNDNTDTTSPGLASNGRSPETSYSTLEQKEGENTGEAPKLVSKHPPGSDNADTKSPKDDTPDILPIAQASVKETSEKNKIEGSEPDNETKPIPEERVAKTIEAYDLEVEDETPQVNDTSLDHKEAGCTKIGGTYPIASKLHATDESGKEDNGCRAQETSDVLPAMQTFAETSSPKDEIQGEESEKSAEQISEEKIEESKVSNLAFKETIQEADDSGLHQELKDDQIKENSTAVNELPTADGSENAEDKPDDLLIAQAIVLKCIQNDKIEASGLASEENIIETMDESLQHGEVKDAKIKECFIQDSKLPKANEIYKTDKESSIEETKEVLPVVQTLVESISEKDEIQSTKKAAKQVSDEKTIEGVEDSNPACEEKIQETDDTILLLKEGEGKEIKGTSVSESREVSAKKMTNTESSTEVKQELLPASQPSVKEILQKNEIQGNESKKENETLPEEKTLEAIKISDFSPEEKFPEASDAGLQKEEGEGSKIAETSLVSELHIFDASVAADKQCQTEKTIDAFPIFAQEIVDKSLQNNEIQGIEPEKVTESRAAVKISEEFEASDLASKKKCPEATDARLQHEDEGVKIVEISHLISEISTVDESNKEDKQTPAEEKADASQPKQSLQEDEIHRKEPEIAEPIHEQGTAEAAAALDLASKEKSAETNSTTLHHEEVKEVGMEEHPNLACELPTVDGSDNADWKPDALPVAQALIQENLEKENIEASGSASGKNIPEANGTSLPQEEIKDAKIEGSFDQVFQLPTANEIDKAGKESPTEETTDVLPVVQTLVQNILEKDETQSAKKAAEQKSEEKTSEEIKDFDLAYEEKIQETDDTILLLKEGEGKETKGTSVNESPEVNENKMTNTQSSMEVKQELLHVSESSPKESLQEDETKGKESEKESKTLPQEKISEAIEVSDFEPKEKLPELCETSLLKKEAEGSQVVETFTSVSELHIFDESENADKQNQTDKKIDAFPIITQAFINESLQTDESFCIESDKATEPRTAAKIPKEFEAYDVACKDKCLEASDASLQREDEGVKSAEISTVDKNDKVDKQTPAEEKADASEASVEETLQREEIHGKEPEMADELVLQQKAAEATPAFDLASEEKCLETDGNKLHQEEVIEVDMEEETNLACEHPTVDVSDNAVGKPDALLIAQALDQENLQGGKINASGLACEDNILEASDKSLQPGEVEDAKIEERMNQVFKLHMDNERDKTGTESLTEETTDVLPVVQTLVENILQKAEVQGGEAKKVAEQISEQKKSTEEIMDSNFVCEEKIQESDDTIMFLKEIEGTEIEGTSVCEYPEVNENKMTNIESSTVIKQELLPASEPLLEEILQEDETQGKESEKASEMLPQEKISEVTEASDFEPKEKFLEACDTNLQKEEAEGSKIAETSNLVSELHIFDESNNEDKQTQTGEKIDTFPIIAQASVDERIEKYEIQGIEPEKATEPRTGAKTAEEFEASVLASQEKCPEATDDSLQNEDEGAKIVEISHLISKISTAAESDKADMQVPAKEKADASSILPALVDNEILQKDEIHFNEPEKADEWISEQKTAEEITAFDIAPEEKSQETNREVENLEMEEHANLFCELPLVNERNNSDKKCPAEEKTNDLPIAQALVDESLQQDEIQSKESVTGDEAIPKEKTVENLKAWGLAYEGKSLTASDASLQHKEAEGTESVETYFVPEISTVNESGKADKQTLTEEKGDPLPIAQALIEKSLRNDEIHSKEPERAAEVLPEQKTAEKILLREDVEIKIMNKEECPQRIPSTIAPVDEADKDNKKLGEPLEISDLVSENLGVESTKAEIDTGIDVLGEEAPMFTTADTSSTTKDVPTENKRKETNLETSVSTQTTEDACLQIEAMKSNQVTQLTDSTGDCSNHIQQNNGCEAKIETRIMEGSQKEDDEEYEIPKSEPKEHVSEEKDGIEVFEGEIPAKKKESEERIGIVLAACVSTEDKAEGKFEEGRIHKQEVSHEHDLKAAESSWILENDTPKEDPTHDFKLNTTSAAQSDVSCSQQEDSETQQIEKVSHKLSKDQSQSDTNTESLTTQARVGENLKTGSEEETDSERVETPTDNDLEVTIVETCAPAKTYSSEDDEKLLEIEASFKEDKKEKGEEPAATVDENVDRKFKDRGNEGVVVHAEISDASKNSGRETQNNDEALEPNLQEDTLEGANNDQSLEVVIEGIRSANANTKEEEDFPENRDNMKRVEESFPDVNQEVKEGTDELEPPNDTIGDVNQNQAMKASDLVTQQQDKRVHSTEKKEAEALQGEGLTHTVDTSVNKTTSTEESTEIQVSYKHQKATATPEEHVIDESNIKLDIPVDANYETPPVDSEPVPEEQSKRTPEMRSTRTETPTDNESPAYTLADPQASVQENTETEIIQMKTEEHFMEQDETSKSMDGEEPESTCEFNFVDKPEGSKATESKERDMIEKESSSCKGIQEDRTEWEKVEMPSPTVFERVEMACAGENVEKKINPVSFKEVKEERFQEDKFEAVKPEAAPEVKPHFLNHETKEANNTTNHDIPNEVPKGLEAEGCVLELNTVSLRDETIEYNLQENEDKKVSEPELETENQIIEMKDTYDKTVDRHSTEEVHKGLEAEWSVLELNTVSIRADTVEENLQENKNKKLREPELETENQIIEMKDTYDKTGDRHSTEEFHKGLEAEWSVLERNSVSIRADTVEENLQEKENKKLREPELKTENQIIEMKDTYDKTVDRHSTEEVHKGLEAQWSVQELNTVSIRADTVEENLQENKNKKLSEPELEAENQICEMKDTDDKTVDGHSTEEIPKGLEAEGSVLELNALSVRADTVEENLQENKDKKLSEHELEAENQIFEMKGTNDRTVDGHSTEEAKRSSLLSTERSNQTKPAFMKDEEEPNQIFETSTVTVTSAENATKEEVLKGLGGEEAVLKLNTESIRVDTVEENLEEDREVKKLSEPGLEAENQILHRDTSHNTEDENPKEEIIPNKDSSLLPTEESYQTGPTEKTETAFLKDEEDPNLSINASPVTITLAEEIAKKEVDDKMENASNLELKKQIHEAATANERSIEFATTKTSAPEGQIKDEKLKESSTDFSFVHNSNTVREAIKLTEPPSIEAVGVIDASPVALASDAKLLQQESEKLYRDSDLVSGEKIQETIDANEVKEMCIVRPEEASCLSSIEQPEEREKAENEVEDPQQLQDTSELVSEKRRHEKIKATEVEEIEIATEASDESKTAEVTDAIPQVPINKTIIAGGSKDQAMEDAQILEIRKLVTGPKVSDENIHDNIPASGEIESMILKDEESRNKKFDSILPDQDLEQEKLSNKETQRLEEAKVTLQNIEVPNEVSDVTSEDNLQTPDVTSSKKATDEDQWLGEASEVELELKGAKHEEDQVEISMGEKGNAAEDSIAEIEAAGSGKILLSDLLQKSTKETLQPAKDFIQERSPIGDEDNSLNKQVATVQIEEEKTCEEEDEEEEKDGERNEESGSDAPVIVEASKDADLKLVHKKPHNILSGVGSKVKHSIAKVRKAITGKSSHRKSQSQK